MVGGGEVLEEVFGGVVFLSKPQDETFPWDTDGLGSAVPLLNTLEPC